MGGSVTEPTVETSTDAEGVPVDETAEDVVTLHRLDVALAGLAVDASPRTAVAFGITRAVLGGFREAIEAGGPGIRETAERFATEGSPE